MLPTADVTEGETVRVYFACLDEELYGRVGYVELSPENPQDVLHLTPEPVLDLGQLGSFDESGVNPSCIVDFKGDKYLYYIGWQRCEKVPHMLFTGLAISTDGGVSFHRYSRTPILDRTETEPFSRSAPFVLHDSEGWKMWYWSCLKWSHGPRGLHYNNVIRFATSVDGVHWDTHKHTCLEPDFRDEYSVGRPWIVQEDGLFRMWYSIRSFSWGYRIGYAESENGIQWTRKDDQVGIETSSSGWDSEMICFSSVVEIRGRRYMFYNGNRYGKTGFGCAVLT